MAVCAKTFALLGSAPYADQMIRVEPHVEIPPDRREPFAAGHRSTPRSPRETKGQDYRVTTRVEPGGPASDCC